MIAENGFAARLRWAREAKGMNMSELARALHITPQAVQQWEHEGGTMPRRARVEQLATLLGVRARWLIYNEPPMVEERRAASVTTLRPATVTGGQPGEHSAWVAAMVAALPEPLRGNVNHRIQVGPRGFTPDYHSGKVTAEIIFLSNDGGSLHAARSRCWSLALLNKMGGCGTALLLVAGRSGANLAGLIRVVSTIQWEAEAMGLRVALVDGPREAADTISAAESGALLVDSDLVE